MKLKKTSAIERELYVAYLQAQDLVLATSGDMSRLQSLRPSQLPFCALNTFITYASSGATRFMDLRGAFYTSVGTAVHEALQTYMGKSGSWLADWRCVICDKWKRLSHQNECCDFDMEYHEVKIDYRGVVGHIDGIFRDSRGRYWIVDYKTTGLASMPVKAKNPGIVYIEQVETYAERLYRQYGVRCHGVVVFFVPRDNPKTPVIWSKTLTDEDYTRITKRTKRYLRIHRQVLAVTTMAEAMALYEHGRCVAPYCKTCRNGASMKARLREAWRIGTARNRLPLGGPSSK